MNGTEQKHHTTVTDGLKKRQVNVETVLAALDARVTGVVDATIAARAEDRDRVAELSTRMERLLGEERTHRLKLAEEQRGYVDQEDQQLRRSLVWTQCRTAVREHTSIWQRLRWILRGD